MRVVTLVDGEERADAIVKTHIENVLQSTSSRTSKLLQGHEKVEKG